MPVLLSENDVKSVLPMGDLIAAMEEALAAYSTGGVKQPLRSVVEIGPHHAFCGVMPAFVERPAALGTKIVTVYGSNASRNLPSHLATIVLLDPETGELLAILDGRYITEARTAAVSAASAKSLARPDSRVAAIVGSGVQARSHIEALAQLGTIETMRVWGRTPSRVTALIDELQPHVRPGLMAADSIEACVKDADVVALVTASREPVVKRAWLAPGTHVCAVGACRPDQREMDTALVRDGRVFVDSRIGALAEAGDLVIPIAEQAIDEHHIVAELGEVIAGAAPGRRTADEVTIFKSLGMAVEDVAAARLAWERAAASGIGRGFVL